MVLLFGGPFAAVAIAIVNKAISAAGDRATGQLLDAITGSRNEQIALLSEIDRKVTSLVVGPFNTGLLFLEDAARAGRTKTERRELLTRARDKFFDALGIEGADPGRRSFIELYLGLTYIALDAWPDAEDHLESASVFALRQGTVAARRGFISGAINGPFDTNTSLRTLTLYGQIRDARIGLGALPTSLLNVTKASSWYEAWGLARIEPDRDPNAAVEFGNPAADRRLARARYWRRYHESIEEETWRDGTVHATGDLARFAGGGAAPAWPGMRDLSKRWDPLGFTPAVRDSPWLHPTQERERLETIAADIASERRARWPQRHRVSAPGT